MQCQASSKRSGQPCRIPAVTGKSYCRIHGGHPPGQSDLATRQHGAHSYLLPETLQESYDRFKQAPDLLDLDPDVALLRLLLNKHLEMFQETGTVSSEHLVILSQVIDRLGKLVERREKVHHLQQNVVTPDRLVAWITQLASGLQAGIEQHVTSEEERKALIQHVRILVAALGVPGGRE